MSQPSSQQGQRPTGYHQFAGSQPPPQFEDDDGPQIYSSVYSGVEVYEMEVNQVAVMRRRNDSHLNATQILKVAGLDKGKRTKILEKEIQTGEHEKVQGGYGKYQGTWISFERGVEVCRQYHVEDLLKPLLTYDMGQDGGIAGRGDLNTPTKEQAMAAQRKKYYSAPMHSRPASMSGTFFQNISSTASNAVAAISKARDSPGPRKRGGMSRTASFNRQPSMQSMDEFPIGSQQSFTSDRGRNPDSAYSTQRNLMQASMDAPEPPRKRQRVNAAPADSFGGASSQNMRVYADAYPGSPTEPNDSFIYSQTSRVNAAFDATTEGDGVSPLPPLPFEESVDAEVNRKTLLSLFAEPAEPTAFEELQGLSPMELDMPIDSQQHTALHWAATLSRMNIVQALIKQGANPFRVNSEGQTPLMRAVIVTNSHDNFSFPELLDLLGNTLEVADNKGRTVLHHIVVTSAIERRHATSKYYLDCLLEWVVRQGSQPSSQEVGVHANGFSNSHPKIGLGKFMTDVVNAQDKVGDTALNLAARISNRSIISQLIEVHADANIPNRVGLRPRDFGIGDVPDGEQGAEAGQIDLAASNQRSKESSDDIVSSMQDLLGETAAIAQDELKKKQDTIDELHTGLRASSSKLAETRRKLESVKEKLKQQQVNRQKVTNLSRELERIQYRMSSIEQEHGSTQSSSAAQWEEELEKSIDHAQSASTAANEPASSQQQQQTPSAKPFNLPDANLLRARLKATSDVLANMQGSVAGLQGTSRDTETKYRRLVALAANCPEEQVDELLNNLVRAVQSEKGELEIGRVRKFLGGVDGV
ncbi:hypothetical protein BD289DRAFT_371318 [Coniella lustricola]|uniref:HTH APSES-type domain-containing protein n=1 Tax=Coniella lustricola TaxID=2025994 RepID=A0A2T3A3V6_9PEZI|nr:hypothetical protein BD289DRAFT_371318 [Coniella lustricola]